MSFDEALSRLDKFRRDSPPPGSALIEEIPSKIFETLEATIHSAFGPHHRLLLCRFNATPDASLPTPQPATSSWHLYTYRPCDPHPVHTDPYPSDALLLPGPLGDPDPAPRTTGLATAPPIEPHQRATGLRPPPGNDVRYRLLLTPTHAALTDCLISPPPPNYFDARYNALAHRDPANDPESRYDIAARRPVPGVVAEALGVYAELYAAEDEGAMQRLFPHVAAYEVGGREERAVVGPPGAVRGDEAYVCAEEMRRRETGKGVRCGVEVVGEWRGDVEGAVRSLLGRLRQVGEVMEERRVARVAAATAEAGAGAGAGRGQDREEAVDGDVGPSEDFLVEGI